MRAFCVAVLCLGASSTCPPEDFQSVDDFNLTAYSSKRWFIQQQAVTSYISKSQNWCVYAEYTRRPKKSLLGYDIDEHTHAEEQDGTVHAATLEAKIIDEKRGKFVVAPGFLPTFLAGDYWVIAYNEAEGYALVSGGPPKVDGAAGKCKNGSGVNGAGLWIFTRAQHRDSKLVEKVRDIASAKGFDLSVLDDIDQSKCKGDVPRRDDVVV